MKFFSYICNCVALDTGMCDFQLGQPPLAELKSLSYLCIHETTRSSDAVLGS